MLQVLFALVALLHVAATLPSYHIPTYMLKAVVENDDCTLPAAYEVWNFNLWVRSYQTAPSDVITFNYRDNSTSLATHCAYNSSSVNVGPEGLTARWACDNPVVQFIWQDQKLTLIEKACPQTNLTRHFEASGSLLLDTDLRCGQQNADLACITDPPYYSQNFSSLQPSPY